MKEMRRLPRWGKGESERAGNHSRLLDREKDNEKRRGSGFGREKKENAKQSFQNSEGITVKNTKLAIINAYISKTKINL